MYQPYRFREDDLNVQHALIRAHLLEHEGHPEPAGCGLHGYCQGPYRDGKASRNTGIGMPLWQPLYGMTL
jgi:hypothetical protein